MLTTSPDPARPSRADERFDPHLIPVSPAATVMLVDDRPTERGATLHVLMVKRTARVVFAPAHWVFPGGRVDPEDHQEDFDAVSSGLTDAEASAILGVESGGLAWWLAACRETLEEAGLLLTPSSDAVDVEHLREQVRGNENVFVDLLLEHRLRVATDVIEEVARFVTPVGSPRRFDARFFVARAPMDQEAHHDDGEIVQCEWVTPHDALRRWRGGEFEMMSPTVRMVECLARYDRADHVMQAARERRPYQRVRVIDPDGEYRVVLPGEAGYDEAEVEVESGWVRF